MRFLCSGIALVCFCLFPPMAWAFNANTHNAMNDSAVASAAPDGFLLQSFLTQELRLPINTEFAGSDARSWIDLGGEREDDWTP